MNIQVKRIYDEPADDDGLRVLVDRLWPRGVSKEKAQVDHWAKVVAPSNELRKWIRTGSGSWEEFCQRYAEELAALPDEMEALRTMIRDAEVATLLFSVKSRERNHALLLRDHLIQSGT